MLIGEYDYEMDIAVQRAEEREIAFAEGIERGIAEGMQQGFSNGIRQTAKMMKQADCSIEFIAKMTGLTVSRCFSFAETRRQGTKPERFCSLTGCQVDTWTYVLDILYI